MARPSAGGGVQGCVNSSAYTGCMRLTDSSGINTLQTWCIGIFLAAALGLSTWSRMAPDRSELVMIQGTLDRVFVVWFGGKSKTRAFALRITTINGAQETVYLHEGSVYDRSRNIYDIAKVEALVGQTVDAHRPPAGWSINPLYDKRVLALVAGRDILLSYDAATRHERLLRWWLAGVAAAVGLLLLLWRVFLGASVATS